MGPTSSTTVVLGDVRVGGLKFIGRVESEDSSSQLKTSLSLPISLCVCVFLLPSCRLRPKYRSYFGCLYPLFGLRSRVTTNVHPQ